MASRSSNMELDHTTIGDEFVVDSLALSALLQLDGHTYQRLEMRGDKAVWVFAKTLALMELVEKFHKREGHVEARAYQAALTNCRRDLFRFLDDGD